MAEDYSQMILHMAFNMENQKQKVNIESLQLNIKAEGSFLVEDEIVRLVDAGYLLKEKDNSLTLTDYGRTESARISNMRIKNEFSEKVDRLTRSSAYLDFCEEVYGYRMYLFNMTDKQQIDFVLNSIPVCSDDTVVDLGCGSGSVLDGLVKKYGCSGIGIDQLSDDIVKRNSGAITYINGDINNFSDYGIKPAVTLCVDSLYFVNDTENLIRVLQGIVNNKMYLFYSQYIFDEASCDKSILQGNNTVLAGILNKSGISYKAVDYSDNERLLYENSLKALRKLKKAFEDEGNTDLYENKLKEDTAGMELYNKRLASRYLYIIE